MGKVYEEDVGTEFRFYAGVDLAEATVLTIYYKKPSGATGKWISGEIWDDTWEDKDGNKDPKYDTKWFRHVTEDGDLDEGDDIQAWEFQIYVELPSGKWRGELALETIHETI